MVRNDIAAARHRAQDRDGLDRHAAAMLSTLD